MDRRTFIRSGLTTAGLVAVGGSAFARSAFGQTRVVHVPSTIASDGSRDVTDRLQTFLDSVPDDRTIVFGRRGTYRVDGPLLLESRRHLHLDGNGASLSGRDGEALPHLLFQGGADLAVTGLHVVGANPNGGVDSSRPQKNWQYQHGLSVRGVNGFTASRVAVSDVYGDGLYAGYGSDGSMARHVTFRNCTVLRNGRQGIALTHTRDVAIVSCTLRKIRMNVIDLEPVRPHRNEHVRIIGNRIGDRRIGFNFVAGTAGVNNDVEIRDNELVEGSLKMRIYAPDGHRNEGWVIRNNRAPQAQTPGTLLELKRCDDVAIYRNENDFSRNEESVFVNAIDCADLRVHHNVVRDVSEVLVRDDACRNCRLWGNRR